MSATIQITLKVDEPRNRSASPAWRSERLRFRPTLLERVAMRLGMCFLIWGTRAVPESERDDYLVNQEFRERHQREGEYERRWLLERPI